MARMVETLLVLMESKNTTMLWFYTTKMVAILVKCMERYVLRVCRAVLSKVEGHMFTLEIMAMFKVTVVSMSRQLVLLIIFQLSFGICFSKETIYFKNNLAVEVEIRLVSNEGIDIVNSRLLPSQEKMFTIPSHEIFTCIISEKLPFYLYSLSNEADRGIVCEIGEEVILKNSGISKHVNFIDSLWISICVNQEKIKFDDELNYLEYIKKSFASLSSHILEIKNPQAIDLLSPYLFSIESEDSERLSIFYFETFRDKLNTKFPSFEFDVFNSSLFARQSRIK